MSLSMYQSNETCSLCNQCEDVKSSLNTKIIGIADNALYNSRYELNRRVDYKTYLLLKYYKKFLGDICSDANCNYCYGGLPENVIERAKILSVL